MKYLFHLMLCMLLAVAGMPTLSAQSKQQRLTREQLAEKQADMFIRRMTLTDEQNKKFRETYLRLQKEVWELNERSAKFRRQMKEAKDKMDSEQAARERLEQRFDRSRQLLDLREKFYKEYSSFMTQKEVQRYYELEKQMRDRLQQRRKAAPAHKAAPARGHNRR